MSDYPPSQPYDWTFQRVVWATLVLVFVALGFWLLYRFNQVVFILFIAIVMGTVIRPVVTWLHRRGLPRIAGVLLVYLLLLALFIVYHLLHFTVGSAHPEFRQGDVYHNVVAGFQVWYASVIYIAAMIALGLHLDHGLWSLCQTLGLQHPRYKRYVRLFSHGFALLVVAGNISFPIAVLTGVVR